MISAASEQRAATSFDARVVATFGRQSLIEDSDGTVWTAVRKGKRDDIVVGDRVIAAVAAPGQAVIHGIEPRKTLLYRTDGHRSKELAANVDQMLVVYAAQPAFNRWFVWKSLVAARAANIDSVVVQNKVDLPASDSARQALQQMRELGWSTLSISAKGEPQRALSELRQVLHDRQSLLVGQSGMGKSTILNLLVPQAQRRTQEFSRHLNLGRQTTTASRWFDLPDGGALVDSPGFQEFGLTHLSLADILAGMPEFAQHLGQCRFADCRHRAEPDCAVIAALQRGDIDADRYRFYLSMVEHFSR